MRFASTFLLGGLLSYAGVYFEPIRGQASGAGFIARTSAGVVDADASSIGFHHSDGSRTSIRFEGARRRALAQVEQPLAGVSHFAFGTDPSRWLWDVPHYGGVRYRGIYRGIDLRYRTSRSDVEFDFLLDPGADPSQIRLRVPEGAHIEPSGALIFDRMRFRAPAAWQDVDGKRLRVPVRFVQAGRRVTFQLGAYDHVRALVIDPVVQFATFLGGSAGDIGVRVLSGPDGPIYTAGNTLSADFPASLPSGDPLERPDILFRQTAYLTRLKPDASAMDWSLFIGGSSRQAVFALKQDPFGNIFLLGGTTSPNFPVTQGAWHTSIDPSLTDLFLVKFDAQTGHIKASTFLGIALYPNTIDAGASLAIDAAGGVYVGGFRLYGGNFAPTPGAFQTTTPSSAFVLRLNSALSAPVYATYWSLGSIAAMEVDSGGNLIVGGVASGSPQSGMPPFPAVNPLPGVNQTPSFPAQAYLAILNPTGTNVSLATLLNGDGRESGISDLKLAPDGSLHIAGWSAGSKFPVINPLILNPQPSIPTDDIWPSPFLARLAADGKSLVQSTLFSGSPYTPPGGEVLNESLRLVLQPNGSPCLLGLNMLVTQQSPGGIVGLPPNSYSNAIGGSLNCEDPAGTTFSVRTGMPPTAGSGYTDVTSTADGALLFTGSAALGFATTPGVVQPKFGGYGTYSYDYSSADQIYPGDALVMRVAMANPAPNIQSVLPDSYLLDTAISGSCSAALSGSGFAYGAVTTLNGLPATLSFADAAHAGISFDCGALNAGENDIAMSLPAPGGGTSTAILTGINAPPSAISISPSSVTQGAAETKLVIRATNLTSASVLTWSGSPRTATFVLDGAAPSRTGHLELLLEPTELAQPFTAHLTVTNPGPGGGVSPTVPFAVQSSGSGAPSVAAYTLLVFGGTAKLGPQIGIGGSGFTASTQAFWDGAQVPVSAVTATSITIQPPSGDLAHWGAHDFYVSNGAPQSLTGKVFVSLAIPAANSAYDPVQNKLYVLGSATFNQATTDLTVLDAATGAVLHSLPTIPLTLHSAVVSADGNYLYMAGYKPQSPAQIVRYNTATNAIDLQWPVSPVGEFTSADINSLATPPDSPETLIASTGSGQVLVFDRDRQRTYDSISAGFQTNYFTSGYPIFFASATRIYGGTPVPTNGTPCWIWLDYDAFGISGGQSACGAAPPETQHDHGLTYLTDGARVSAISLPPPLTQTYAASLAADLTGRHAWQSTNAGYLGYQLFDYKMDSEQFQLKAQLNAFSYGIGPLYATAKGVLMVLPDYTLLIP